MKGTPEGRRTTHGRRRGLGALLLVVAMGSLTACVGDDTNFFGPEAGVFDTGTFETGGRDGSVLDAAGDVDVPDGAAPDANVPDAGKEGGVDAGPLGRAVGALVPGGTVSRSAGFKLVGTLGTSPGAAGVAKSSNYKLHDGVVGATQAP
jgi:hypothetical protein